MLKKNIKRFEKLGFLCKNMEIYAVIIVNTRRFGGCWRLVEFDEMIEDKKKR